MEEKFDHTVRSSDEGYKSGGHFSAVPHSHLEQGTEKSFWILYSMEHTHGKYGPYVIPCFK